MKKKFIIIHGLILSIVMLFIVVTPAHAAAAPAKFDFKGVFDPHLYADLNPDVKAVCGYNRDKLYSHWLARGIMEGRMSSYAFDTKYYLAHNPDIAKAVGSKNYVAAYNHFIYRGYLESRSYSLFFDKNYYLSNNNDVRQICGNVNSIYHFVGAGMKEGRAGSAQFNPVIYANKYADLRNAYGGSSYYPYFMHYLFRGIIEGRNTQLPNAVAQNYQFLDVRYPSKVTASEINSYINNYERATGKTSAFHGQGQLFIDIGTSTGINQLILVAMTIHESAYGTNPLSKYKFNLFSVAAYDSSVYDSAYTFTSVDQSIRYQARFLKSGYLNPSSWKFKGYYLGDGSGGMNYYYASDKNWGKAIATHANNIHPFNPYEYTNISIMTGSAPVVALPNIVNDFSNLAITGSAVSNIPLSAVKNGSTVATLPAGASFQVLQKTNDNCFEINYNNSVYFFKVDLSKYNQYFHILNLLRTSDFRYITQLDPNVIPAGCSPSYR